jgi:FkbM family methyltransferase
MNLKNMLIVANFYIPLFIYPHQEMLLHQMIKDIIPCREDGKIFIPSHIKHVKLDIGLSYNAPISQYWLTHEKDLIVFGFEPNPESVLSILHGALKKNSAHGDPLNVHFIGKQFFLVPCALSDHARLDMDFYVTRNDCGCSSLYRPQAFAVEKIIKVPVYTLEQFFDLFPWDSHPVIDYIKIDAQGADLSIARGAGHYLAERVIYITLEAENAQYCDTINSERAIDSYMQSIGFVRHVCREAIDPTYFNTRFAQYVATNQVTLYQRG